VAFTFKYVREIDGHRRRVVFEESVDPATGAPRLVVTHIDGEFGDDEMEHLYAEALAKWMHPNEPPRDWFG
jgi:hypothetical protein